MSLSLRALRYVDAAVRCGSLAAAADHLNVTPSAIAAALDQAEDVFGMTLATRVRAKGLAPTSAGRDVQRRIADLIERYDSMLADVADFQTGLTGNLAIGYNAPIAPAFLPSLVAPLLAAHPDLTVTLSEGDNETVQDGLLDGRFETILFVSERPDPRIETVPLLFAPTYCLCSSDHTLARRESVTVDEIIAKPIIFLDRPAARTYYRDLLESSGRPYRIVATANSTEMARSLVGAGLGLALLNMRPRDALPYSGGAVRCLRIEASQSGVMLSLGCTPGPRRRIVDRFVEASVEYFQTQDAKSLIVSS